MISILFLTKSKSEVTKTQFIKYTHGYYDKLSIFDQTGFRGINLLALYIRIKLFLVYFVCR